MSSFRHEGVTVFSEWIQRVSAQSNLPVMSPPRMLDLTRDESTTCNPSVRPRCACKKCDATGISFVPNRLSVLANVMVDKCC